MMNKRCFIICAGDYYGMPVNIQSSDYIIAADAGLKICNEIGITPNLIIGDFDSLGTCPKQGNVIQLPVEKDDTDTLRAVRMAIAEGFREIYIIAGTGGERFDHTMANLQTLSFIANKGCMGYLFDKLCVYTVIKNSSIHFAANAKGTLSCFCLDGKAEGVSIKGLKYEIEDAVITSDYPIGVSNSFCGTESEIIVKQGALLIVSDIESMNYQGENRMVFEKSCGAVIYTIMDGKRRYLVEKMVKGHSSICKGHVENEETEHETATREIREETSLSVRFIDGFREVVTYSPKEGHMKDVVFFLAEALTTDAKPQPEEVSEISWMTYDEVMDYMTFPSDRATMKKAEEFLNELESRK